MPDEIKTHYFRDANDNQMIVKTAILPIGYGACLDGDKAFRGFGATRMEAIVDLREALEDELDDGE